MNYQTEQSTEAIKGEIISYKNNITKLIQTDAIKGELKSVKLNQIEKRANYSGEEPVPPRRQASGGGFWPLGKNKETNAKIITNLNKFSAISTNIEENTPLVDDLNIGVNYFDLDITISNNELGGDYHIKIVTPLNYPYCK